MQRVTSDTKLSHVRHC